MNKENIEILVKDFPDLYREFNEKGNIVGFDVMDGWFHIIYELSEKISQSDPNCVAIQVKEKFGGLRFYVGPSTKTVLDIINEYEYKAYKTCENCGTEEGVKQHSGGWIKTLCDNCHIEFEKEKEERWKEKLND
jgi:hypothetical protein